jgi:hypothetical protein
MHRMGAAVVNFLHKSLNHVARFEVPHETRRQPYSPEVRATHTNLKRKRDRRPFSPANCPHLAYASGWYGSGLPRGRCVIESSPNHTT